MDGRRWETGSSFAGEEAGQEVLDLWVDAEGVGDAALPGDPELPAEGLGVVKEDEVGLPTLAVGEVPGAEGLGEEDGGLRPEEGVQHLGGEGRPLAAGAGEGEVHPQALEVQGGLTPALLALPEVLAQVPAGDGAVQEHRAAGGGVGLRQVEGPAASGKALPQGLGQGAEVLPGGGLKVQHGPEEAPAQALPLQGGGQGLRVRQGRGLPVAEEQEAALGI